MASGSGELRGEGGLEQHQERRNSVLFGGSAMFTNDRQPLLVGDTTEKLSYGTLTTDSRLIYNSHFIMYKSYCI
jgi:hypothetical protein